MPPLVQHSEARIRNRGCLGGASISLTYIAAERIIPGYGGGMSSAKAALESDTKVLSFEAGRRHKIRVNTISVVITVIFILLLSETWYLLEYLPVVTFFTLMKTQVY
ncbi:enoyl-[acyl-carrier-protein] reductase [NADH] 1, chloroplastic-like [Magnolia sinica]|uniref:enoyl-[acyl-carrier-protein] reductase [NADH] 1, chloroplastic-like n=1 Tax=Magnolia sinica TaxID=86752 RepID=UPI00265A0BF8|nr:enoyl-[acyl-carrier-protein] reductase [NADH] 1, chloroplastic-like [Magnolia sinica]